MRGSKRSNALAGKCAGRPPYGYRAKDGKSNQEWEIDDCSAEIVREIFRRFIAGDSTHTIAKDFHSRDILTPMVYYRRLKGLPPLNEDTTWFNYTVVHMIENQSVDMLLKTSHLFDPFCNCQAGIHVIWLIEIPSCLFMDYLNRYRVRQSIDVMQKTEATLKQIAEDVGFVNYKTFTRAFYKIMVMPLDQYRRGLDCFEPLESAAKGH